MLRTGYIFNKNFNSLLTYKHLTLAGLLVIASPSRSGVLFFILSFLRRKERTKQERKVAGCIFLAEKGMCFRNKMNLLPLGASNSILFFRKRISFSFRQKNEAGMAQLGFSTVITQIRCLLRKCAVCPFLLYFTFFFFAVCFANVLLRKFASLFALALASQNRCPQIRFALCYFLKKLKGINIFPWKFYTLR